MIVDGAREYYFTLVEYCCVVVWSIIVVERERGDV
jgi:hypothetical protein